MTQSAEETPPVTFDAMPLTSDVRKAIDDLGYTHPTPVQRAVFEVAARGRDLVVQARTGTGKTAAFGLPLVDSLVKVQKPVLQAMVLCPTRELALQITRELTAIAKHRGTKVVAVYGGAPMGKQIEQLKDGAQILVGTPGRVLDHLRRGTLDTSACKTFVLDESDEMLSMGFLPQISEIWSYLPEQRQVLLFSATLPPDVKRVAETRLKNPEYITLSGDNIGALSIQHFVYMTMTDKLAELIAIIETENPESAIIFSNTRDDTKRVAAGLQAQGYQADWLNADLAQNERESVMAATRKGELRFLVCTDVAARGIDISHLTHVINFDFPESAESYVHRTGRTGRAGRTGTAISLIAPSNIGALYLLRLTYKIRPIERHLPSARERKTRAEADLVQVFVEAAAARPIHSEDLALARRMMTHDTGERVLAMLLRDHLGARPDALDEATAARRAKSPTPAAAPVAPAPEAPPARIERPREDRPREDKPPEDRPRLDRPREDRPRIDRPREDRPRIDRPRDDRPRVDRPREDRPREDRPREDRPREDRPREDRPRIDRPREDRPREDRPREDQPREDRPREDQPRDERPRDDRPRERERRPQRLREERPSERRIDEHRTLESARLDLPAAVRKEPPPPEVVEPSSGSPNPATTTGVAAEAEASDPIQEIFVNVGRRDGAKPSDFQSLLAQHGITGEPDYIRVRHSHAFVGVRGDMIERAVAALNGAVIAGQTASAELARRR
ncbi:MAG: DEAD/DEAH box helicase [Myxococcales bacterium]|nr:MAG: DEAD/DEAH box helicase [Myxococcales bacterium]